jgi:hypothetical protein
MAIADCRIRKNLAKYYVHHIVRWNRVARRRRQDGQTNFIVWADICNAVLNAVQHHNRLSVLLRNALTGQCL